MLSSYDTGLTRLRPTIAAQSFLGRLCAKARARIEPHIEEVDLPRGTRLFCAADTGEHVYFPKGVLISLEQRNGVEIAVVGTEGLVGWQALAGCTSAPHGAVISGRGGGVLRVRSEVVLSAMSKSPSVGLMLQNFVNVINVQMAETISAFASHRMDVRLARWILLRHDRVGGDEITSQHDEIAENLCARRASITDCLHIIEGQGLVRCRRGRIIVQDRRGLEALAAECYGAAESYYCNAIGRFGKSTPSSTAPVQAFILQSARTRA